MTAIQSRLIELSTNSPDGWVTISGLAKRANMHGGQVAAAVRSMVATGSIETRERKTLTGATVVDYRATRVAQGVN